MAANIRFSNPKTLAKPPGYSYVVEATGPNRLIFIAGQLGLDMENKLVGAPGDFRAQANQAVENLKLALADAGATIKDVVKINNYLVDMSHIAIFREVRDHHFNMSAPPASTTVAISQLARPGALFEIEAIAVLPAKVAKAAKPAAATQQQGQGRATETKIGRRHRTIGMAKAETPWWTWACPAAAWVVLLMALAFGVSGLMAVVAETALMATVFAAVYHAEVVAHRTGEPFGTLVLAVAVTVIEVALIVSIMISAPDGKPELARDTVFAAVMIVCNGIVGLCLLAGGARHHEQGFQIQGASAALAVLAALTVLTLVLPNVATTAPGPFFSPSQLVFAAVVSLLLYGSFVFIQTVRHRDYFLADRPQE